MHVWCSPGSRRSRLQHSKLHPRSFELLEEHHRWCKILPGQPSLQSFRLEAEPSAPGALPLLISCWYAGGRRHLEGPERSQMVYSPIPSLRIGVVYGPPPPLGASKLCGL